VPRRAYDDDYGWWERHGPRLPANGIKAKAQRGAFGKSWWATQWIEALERLVDSGRLQRGRSYARSGQVVKLEVGPGLITAQVQGSEPKPYRVSVHFKILNDATWERVIDGMAAEAIYAARLLNGEMPEDIEKVFESVGAHLLPAAGADMETSCSCPDPANPCKHVAAVHYLLAERLDEDPFLMFLLRGRGKEQVIEALRARRVTPGDAEPEAVEAAPAPPADPTQFWSAPALEGEIALKFALPEADALVVKRLGNVPFVRDERGFLQSMEQVYHEISEHALLLALDDPTA
jgi:uncharacterized Zn finger protein